LGARGSITDSKGHGFVIDRPHVQAEEVSKDILDLMSPAPSRVNLGLKVNFSTKYPGERSLDVAWAQDIFTAAHSSNRIFKLPIINLTKGERALTVLSTAGT
jgi:hypothetical protein